MTNRFRFLGVGVVLILLASLPAAANMLGTISATEDCTGFTVTASGPALGTPTATVDFSITLTPTSGSPVTISDSFVVTRIPHTHGSYSGTFSQTWSNYGVTLSGTYALTGQGNLVEPHIYKKSIKSISFSPSSLTCGGGPPPGSCQPSSSLGVLVQGTSVTTYVPKGAWDTGTTGLSAVSTEGSGTTGTVSTPNAVNSCASNATTGVTVCTSNVNDVYLLTGTTLNTTLSSGGNQSTCFSGGCCVTCGVAMNATANKAVVTIGYSGGSSGSGIQILDLASNTFGSPIGAFNQVSEDILWDETTNHILSPNEGGVYDIFDAGTGTEYANVLGDGTQDSAGEECATGIALSTIEFTSELYIADLTQATFVSGTPGSWSTTGSQVQNFPEFGNLSAGTSGIAVAQGSHLGIVTGEFGGNTMGVIQLPSTSGSGTPGVVDYADATLPNTPDGNPFSDGLDPHTVTAYVSPNTSDAVGLMANYGATWLAVIDLTKLLAAPRTSGTHYVDPTYDLIANGVLSYIAVP